MNNLVLSKPDALRCIPDRFTMEHVPPHASILLTNGLYPAPQFLSDDEWCGLTRVVSNEERLALGIAFVEWTSPTRPLGDFMIDPYVVAENEQVAAMYAAHIVRIAEARAVLYKLRNDPQLLQEQRNLQVEAWLRECRLVNLFIS